MPVYFFYLFAAAAIISASLVVLKRDPLISAIFLIITLCNIAALYLFFGAGFLAAVQIIVYAGAVMVLFLFIIMLLPAGADHEEGGRGFKWSVAVGALFFATELVGVMVGVAASGSSPVPGWVLGSSTPVTISNIGELLFSRFLIPLELVSFLLLVAVIGVVMLTGVGKKKSRSRSI